MLPSGETSTAVTAAHGAPFGGCPQSRTVRNGLGKSLIGVTLVSQSAVPAKTARAVIRMMNLIVPPLVEQPGNHRACPDYHRQLFTANLAQRPATGGGDPRGR